MSRLSNAPRDNSCVYSTTRSTALLQMVCWLCAKGGRATQSTRHPFAHPVTPYHTHTDTHTHILLLSAKPHLARARVTLPPHLSDSMP